MARVANIFEDSAVEGVGQTTVNKPDIDTGNGSSPPDHVHVHYDLAHQACLAEIASLFEDIQADLRIITDRGDDRSKGIYQRDADTVANNPANIAQAARDYVNLQQSGILTQVNAEIGYPTNLGNTSPTNYGAIRNSTNNAGGFVGGTTANSQSPGFAGSTTFTSQDGQTTYTPGTVPLADVPLNNGTGKGNITYAIGSTRSLPIQKQLFEIISTAATNAAVDVKITSGGQVPISEGGVEGKNRIGSNRHDKGFGADVALFSDGRLLIGTNADDLSVILKFIKECEAAGATGVGFGNGYMNDRCIHVDIAWIGQKAGLISGIPTSRYWGGVDTRTANAPRYLADVMNSRDNVA